MNPNNFQQSFPNSRRYRRYYTYLEPVMADPLIRGYFSLIASIFLIAFFLIFALSPTITTILGLIRKIDDQTKTIATMDSKINNLIAAQENYSRLENSLPLLSEAVPEKPHPETILDDVTNLASSSGVSLNSLQFGPIDYSTLKTKTNPPASTPSQPSKLPAIGLPLIQFTLGITGNETQVHAFLSRLQHMPRLITLTAVSFQAQEKSTALAVDVKGVGYYLFSGKL